jgi:DNA replicative helicase MCM subunit Mcm2 (Cdc46/Mcm family)
MPTGADANGFGNRFLYVYVYRAKDCPQGGPPIDWMSEILQFQEIVGFAKTVKHVSMSGQARKWWNTNYARLENEGPDGLAGRMTARAAAHIRRLAMIYALIDSSGQIELEHFQAAKALWDYCAESAMFIFGGVTKEQLRIVQWINQRGSATFKQVRDELYHRHKPVADIRADLDSLVKTGQLTVKSGVYVVGHRTLVA